MSGSLLRRAVLACTSLACVAVVAACSTAPPSATADTGKDGVKQGPGVTDTSIALATLTDLSGPYAAGGNTTADAQREFFAQLNERGGVCGRQVDFEVKDTGYDVQRTVTAYAQTKDSTLGYVSVAGGPMNAALLPSYQRDTVTSIAVSFTPDLIQQGYNIMLPGPTYAYWVTNAVDYLLQEGGVSRGGTLGLVYFAGDAGKPVLDAAKYAADASHLQLASAEVQASATDMAGVVTNLKRAGASSVLVQGTPAIVAGIAGAASAAGLSVPLVTVTGGAFNPGLLNTPAAAYLTQNLRMVLPWRMTGLSPQVQGLIDRIAKAHPQQPINENSVQAIGMAATYTDILRSACEAKDLSRQGVLDAVKKASDVDTMGIFVPLDYSKQGRSPAREVFINKVDPDGLAGEAVLSPQPFSGPLAQNYTAS